MADPCGIECAAGEDHEENVSDPRIRKTEEMCVVELLLGVNWIALFALTVALLLCVLLYWLSYRINWTLVILLSLVMGAVLGIVFASEDNAYLVWLDLIGNIYVNAITALVAPVILVSILSGFIALNDRRKMRSIGLRSVFWLMLSAAAGIALSLLFGLVLGREPAASLPRSPRSATARSAPIRICAPAWIRYF